MPSFQIEVDEEVYSYLKSRIQEFGDTPNLVLRRELPINGRPGRRIVRRDARTPEPNAGLPQVPFGTLAALEQTLQVVHLVHTGGLSRSEATHVVASHHRVAPQTVLDKYTRQLGLTAGEFDQYLAEDELRGLKGLLKRKFDDYDAVIDRISG